MLDVIIIAVVVAAAVMGFRKGFIGQLGSVAAIIIGVVACRLFGPQVTDMIMPAGQGPEVNSMSKYAYSILAYAGVYIVAYYAVILVARLLRTVTHTLLLGPLDHMAGAVVSIVKWLLALSVALNLYAIIVSGSDLGSRSRLGKETVQFIMEIAPAAWGAFTQNFQEAQHGS